MSTTFQPRKWLEYATRYNTSLAWRGNTIMFSLSCQRVWVWFRFRPCLVLFGCSFPFQWICIERFLCRVVVLWIYAKIDASLCSYRMAFDCTIFWWISSIFYKCAVRTLYVAHRHTHTQGYQVQIALFSLCKFGAVLNKNGEFIGL